MRQRPPTDTGSWPPSGVEALLTQDSSNRLCEIVEIISAQPGDVHAAVVGHVNMMLLTQGTHLPGIHPEKRKHPPLLGNEAEIALRTNFRQPSHQRSPQAPDSLAHARQFVDPLL